MALIRLAFGVSSMFGESGRGGAELADIHSYPQQLDGLRPARGTGLDFYAFSYEFSVPTARLKSDQDHMESVMTISANRLPDQFPIGSKYVVEGRGGGDGNLRVFSRYIVMPDGRRIDLPADFARPTPQRARFRRRPNGQPKARPSARSARELMKNHG